MIKEFTAWLIDLVTRGFKALWDLLADGAIWVLDGLLSALGGIIAAIPVPDFLSSASLSSLMNQLPDYVRFFVGQLGLGQAFALIAAGFAFRMLRKVFTLGQW